MLFACSGRMLRLLLLLCEMLVLPLLLLMQHIQALPVWRIIGLWVHRSSRGPGVRAKGVTFAERMGSVEMRC